MPLPEQERLVVMNTMVDKYSQLFYISYDLFSGTYVTSRAYMLLPLHSRSILGDMDG